MNKDEVLEGLTKLSKLMGFSFCETDYIIQIVAQTEYDPLPPNEWGEVFEFSRQKLAVFPDDDFVCINPTVPKPDAQVDFREARQEYKDDVRAYAIIDKEGRTLSLEQSLALFISTWDWFRFWSVRHPDPAARAWYAQAERESQDAAERLVMRATTRLSRSGK
jgi:hypothetical protein